MPRLLLGLVYVLLALHAVGQVDLSPERFTFEPGIDYNSDIPSPAQFLGYELGEEFTVYAQSVAYFYELGRQTDRILINQYGKTYEKRPLISIVISSAENLARLDQLRNEHLRLADPSRLKAGEADQLTANQPVFVSYSYSIHGNEASSTEAAMQVAYRLAAAQDAATEELLRNVVLIMYPCINPDGRDRYVYWYNGMRRSVVGLEPDDMEHYEPWPNGRTNHYWFDLNRDWIWGVHPESRGHTADYQRWMPQVHVDFHEQGYDANYFTTPGTTPRNQLLPDRYEAWTDTFGRANIAEFDRYGISYFTRDRFDFFYPGYGSSYPSVMGAIGMLNEQGGIGAGRAVETEDGYVLIFRQRIFDHYLSSLATLRKAAQHRRELLRYSVDAWTASKSKEKSKTYVIVDDGGAYLSDVVNMLLRNGVRVERANVPFVVSDAMDYRSGKRGRQQFQRGAYIVRGDQPRHLLVHSVMARNLAIEDSVMYDMATWALPLAYNLTAFASDQSLSVATEAVSAPIRPDSGLTGGGADAYAYVIDWSQRRAPRALAMLWEKGYRVRASVEAFGDGKQTFPPGSLIILRGRNLEQQDSMPAHMDQIAREAGLRIHAYATGRMANGHDLASTRNRPIDQPKVAMLVEPPFDAYTAGQVYYLFDQEVQLPLVRIKGSTLRQTALPRFGQRYGYADLNDYDVVIFPGGGMDLEKVIGKDQVPVWKDWLERGGTIVALEDAVPFFTEKGKFNKLKLLEPARDSSEAAAALRYEDREDYYGKKTIPGTALLADIDNSNPLAFGLPDQLYTLKFDVRALAPDATLESVGRYVPEADQLFTAGYSSADNLKSLAGKTFAGVLSVGQGRIVYLLDNPHYRMFWRGPTRMMENAVMLVPGF